MNQNRRIALIITCAVALVYVLITLAAYFMRQGDSASHSDSRTSYEGTTNASKLEQPKAQLRPDETEEVQQLWKLFPELVMTRQDLLHLGFTSTWRNSGGELLENAAHDWQGLHGLGQATLSEASVVDFAFWTDDSDEAFASAIATIEDNLGEPDERVSSGGDMGGELKWHVQGNQHDYRVVAANQRSMDGFRRYLHTGTIAHE